MYKTRLLADGSKYKFYLNDTLVNQLDITTTVLYNSTSSNRYLNICGFSPYPFYGSIDLKQFSITVDGVEVFSGNKTGIDTIKPVDFTAITSGQDSPFENPDLPFSDSGLTISTDGVASGFSAENQVYKQQLNISTNNLITFKGKCVINGTGDQRVFSTNATRTESNTTNQSLGFSVTYKRVFFDCYINNVFTIKI